MSVPWLEYKLYKLFEITLPLSLKTVGFNSFYGCDQMKRASVPALVASSLPNSLEEVELISGTSIANGAFKKFNNLCRIVLPDTITEIGESAFFGCASLESIKLPDSITSLEKNVFSGCYALKEIVIPSSVTSIGEAAFSGCKSLEKITMPSNLQTLGKNAFAGCTSLK